MHVPHVPRVTVSDSPSRNGDAPDPLPINVVGRIETLTDGVATANRAAIALRAELEALRYAVVFALILAGAYFVWKEKSL